jgi:hypothetical protein
MESTREIKFRVWDVEEKVWSTKFIIDCLRFPSNRIVSISQFTGQKDCTGKEIWEGDIIEFDRREWGGDDNIFVVEWDSHNAGWSFGGGSIGDMEFRTVIGNIYEHPKLLK